MPSWSTLRLVLWPARSRFSQLADRSLDTGLSQQSKVSSRYALLELQLTVPICLRSMLVILQFRDRRRDIQHQCGLGCPARRHSSPIETSNPNSAEDNIGERFRYGSFRHRSGNIDGSIFS